MDDYRRTERDSDAEIEELLKSQKTRAERILSDNLPLLKEVADYLIKFKKIESEEFVKICKKHKKNVKYLDAKEIIVPDYELLYKQFSENF